MTYNNWGRKKDRWGKKKLRRTEKEKARQQEGMWEKRQKRKH